MPVELDFYNVLEKLPDHRQYVLIYVNPVYVSWCDDEDVHQQRYFKVAQYDKEGNMFREFGPGDYEMHEVLMWAKLPGVYMGGS